MSASEIGSIIFTLAIILAASQCVGYLFERLKQPKLVGEILAGILVGPFVLGKISPTLFDRFLSLTPSYQEKTSTILYFIYWIGLLLLMFISGSETRRLMAKENRRITAWLLGMGISFPFLCVLALGLYSWIPLDGIIGEANQKIPALLVISIAVAVTSIPVISRIFYDLKILHTRFASIILGTAVIEDIILWGILSVATSIVSQTTNGFYHEIFTHVGTTMAYIGFGLLVAPSLLRKINATRWNLLLRSSPVGYLFFILFLYAALASALDVNLIFASFLAGFGVIGGFEKSEKNRFEDSLNSINKVAFGIFIPIYFAMVGYKLIFGREFSFSFFIVFLIGSSLLKLFSVGLGAYFAGFKKLDIANLAITSNARGGPGIVLASVAYDVGIISGACYTTLVLTAILTSQFAGVWLRSVLAKGLPLLKSS
ncbi:MAG: hypothetical protein A3G32_06965 [Deltaproteobacteria bacterium RIFCSPLOWO2_12_FULL_40_28]|nr:MAG: hypothetical protein A3C45_07010 [Deltaproteobacteria bacterium RIFCSPHIGHO2_02_FULL_40_28]OGQ19303.1 MAG: hypothetical protein A3E27_04805 [Deltaproteobacteria bacterium RIFCSPHIGHO2_12_FULL_40_32]OGQ40473.1 MAG: hypothetical protein A3I69_00265 [Deltaproteobacteria bacterium RIFCSPLOWO2_02_FULL_40_36]OGQ53709.1 MAG: hypothetical protein A3G32_06965 [Deltaproteobacteria bacterium RIFCSPLOWO2_12_FULL_40_28]